MPVIRIQRKLSIPRSNLGRLIKQLSDVVSAKKDGKQVFVCLKDCHKKPRFLELIEQKIETIHYVDKLRKGGLSYAEIEQKLRMGKNLLALDGATIAKYASNTEMSGEGRERYLKKISLDKSKASRSRLPLSAAEKKRLKKLALSASKKAALRNTKPIEIKRFSAAQARVLAHLIGDGGVTGNTLFYTNKNMDLITQFKEDVKNEFGLDGALCKRKWGCHLFRVCSKKLVERLPLMVPCFGSHQATVPQNIFGAMPAVKKEFLRALFDDEGCVSCSFNRRKRAGYVHIHRRVELYSESEKLRTGLKLLLSDFKVYCVDSKKRKRIIISGFENIKNFYGNVGFSDFATVVQGSSYWLGVPKNFVLQHLLGTYGGKGKTYFIECYGCTANRLDGVIIDGLLQIVGFRKASDLSKADFVIVNSCGVKTQTENKIIRRVEAITVFHKKPLILAGCLAPMYKEELNQKFPSVSVFIGPNSINRLLYAVYSLESKKPAAIFSASLAKPRICLPQNKNNDFVKIISICDGCLGACSYCSTVTARGKLKSFDLEIIQREFKIAIEEGYKEIWLTAQDCGCYGFDLGTNLAALVERLLQCSGDNFRVRIGMMNPGHLQKFLPGYLDLFRDKRLYRFFHLPVQSGSNEVLRAMNRPYTRRQFLRIVGRIRKAFPDAGISLDLIAGFPGETDEQFLETVSLVKAVGPDVVNISRFGARPNTLAAKMPGQLHGRVKKERSRILSKLCREIALERNKRFVGKEQEIFVNEIGPKGGFVGRNQNYKPVVLKKSALGNFARVRAEKAFPTCLLAGSK